MNLVELAPPPNACAFCHKASTTLKRCTGCTVILYCSKTCQKQDWHIHKPYCRVSPDKEVHKNYIKCGYTAPAAVTAKIREWTEAQNYALTFITNAAVQLARAPGEELEDTLTSQRAMVFSISPHGDNPHEVNPSMAFRILKSGFFKKDDNPFLKSNWSLGNRPAVHPDWNRRIP